MDIFFSFLDFPIFFSPEGSKNITEKSRNSKTRKIYLILHSYPYDNYYIHRKELHTAMVPRSNQNIRIRGFSLTSRFFFFCFGTVYRIFKFLLFLLAIITYEKHIFIMEIHISIKSLNLSLTNDVFVLLKKND